MASVSKIDVQPEPERLKLLLSNLPSALPEPPPLESIYKSFIDFQLGDGGYLEKNRSHKVAATLGEQLEYIFRPQAQTTGDGIIPIQERS